MTVNLDLPEITDEDIRAQLANQLGACQHGNQPFTPAELETITRYGRAIIGVRDALDYFTADSIRHFRDEFGELGETGAHAMLRGHFRLLDQWSEAYTVLKLDGLPRDDEGAFSPAATRFLGRELVDLQNAGRALHAALAEYVLGKDENGYPYGSLAPAGGYRHVDGMFWVDPA